jgi:hypothetical protein
MKKKVFTPNHLSASYFSFQWIPAGLTYTSCKFMYIPFFGNKVAFTKMHCAAYQDIMKRIWSQTLWVWTPPLPCGISVALQNLGLVLFLTKCYISPMFIAALFTIAKLLKQPRCPRTDEWIKKMWFIYVCIYIFIHTHTHTVEFYSAINKKKIMFFAAKWMELENIMLREVSQAQKVKGHIFLFICGRYTYKLNVYINTYMIIYMYIHRYSERTRLHGLH